MRPVQALSLELDRLSDNRTIAPDDNVVTIPLDVALTIAQIPLTAPLVDADAFESVQTVLILQNDCPLTGLRMLLTAGGFPRPNTL